jgi:hypothetical protein
MRKNQNITKKVAERKIRNRRNEGGQGRERFCFKTQVRPRISIPQAPSCRRLQVYMRSVQDVVITYFVYCSR